MTNEEHHSLLSDILKVVRHLFDHMSNLPTQADLDSALADFKTALTATATSINQKLSDLQAALSAAQASGGTTPDFTAEIQSIKDDTALLQTIGAPAAPAPAPTDS